MRVLVVGFGCEVRGEDMDRLEIKKRLEEGLRDFKREWTQEGALIFPYGFHVDVRSDDGAEFDLTFTFLAGETYCCLEYGCHFGLDHEEAWAGFRKKLEAHGWQPGRAMRIWHVSVRVEAGAMDRGTGTHHEYPFLGAPWCYEMGPEIEAAPNDATPPETSALKSNLELAEEGVAEHPEDYREWRRLAEVRSFPTRWSEALEPMRKAIALAPDNVFLRGSYVQSLALAERHAEVVRESEEVLRLFPGQAWAERMKTAARERCGSEA
jgi:hypothetical protein